MLWVAAEVGSLPKLCRAERCACPLALPYLGSELRFGSSWL